MSQNKLKVKEETNQPSVLEFYNTPKGQRQQRSRSRSTKRKDHPSGDLQRESKQRNTMTTPEEKGNIIHQEETEMEQLSPKEARMKNMIMEAVQLLLRPLQNDIKDLLATQKSLKDDIIEAAQLKEENKILNTKLEHIENKNKQLTKRVNDLENKLLDSNIVLHGVPESAWETEAIRQDKVYDVISDTIIGRSYDERIEVARTMYIKSTRRIGPYSQMRTRPISVEFLYKGDAEYVLVNRKYLSEGIYVDKEYCKETEEHRRVLRPYFKAARKLPQYHRKCRLEGETLVLRGISYTVDNLDRLPCELSGFNISSKFDDHSFGFFGSIHPFSNFHPAGFEFNGVKYHSSEQMIQHMKALQFEDQLVADRILHSTTAYESKKIAMDIQNYNHEQWITIAKDKCVGGIRAKFDQNPTLQHLLLSTGNKTIVESCYDAVWGSGIALHQEHCLDQTQWKSQGILGEILELVRDELRNIPNKESVPATVNSQSSADVNMDTAV